MSFKETEIGIIPKEWNVYVLEDVVDRVKVGFVGSCNKDYCEEENGVPMIRTTNLSKEGVQMNDLKYVTRSFYEKNKKSQLKNGDILIARHGSNGLSSLWDKDIEAQCLNVVIVETNKDKCNPKFLNYVINSDVVKNQILAMVVGSVQGVVNTKSIAKIKIPYPNLKEQSKIVEILQSIDEKFSVNNKINKKLEETAQAIFKQWFIDFEFPNEDGEPYKSSGGEMVESELGMIPEGWNVGYFRDFTDTVLGGDWGKETEQGNYNKEVLCLRGADIPEIKCGKFGAPAQRYILEKNYNNKKLNAGDLVVEISGGSPTQSTGRITYINEGILNRYDLDFVCTNFCRAITISNKKAMEYFYFYWSYLYDLNVFFQYENGTTGIKNFDANTFLDKHQIIVPPNHLLERYHQIVSNLLNTIQHNGLENSKLMNTRDILLPKLMSGEIRVPLD